MRKSDLCIDVLGTQVTITTDEDPVYLRKLLEKYKNTVENVKKVSGLNDPLKLSILTGFLLSHDLEKLDTASPNSTPAVEIDEESGEVERLTLGIISLLDEALDVPIHDRPIHDVPIHDTPIHDGPFHGETATGKEIYKLHNSIKKYGWGSTEWIPALLGEENEDNTPWAELWMGVNPSGPSSIILPQSGSMGPLLSEIINQNSNEVLGKKTEEKFGKLPYLMKLLAAARPLSVQVHPNLEQAKSGYERENQEGIPDEAPNRSYHDPNHKPEIICALGPFLALCGFRKVVEIHTLLTKLSMTLGSEGIVKDTLDALLEALRGEKENPYKDFLSALFNTDPQALSALGSFIKSHSALLEMKFPENINEWKLASFFTGFSSGDPGLLAPLYLNIIELESGEAIYLPSGVPHTYVHGFGLELMADSDNVLRGGLTNKFIDRLEFLNILNYSEYKPTVLKNEDPESNLFDYPAPAEEFKLSRIFGKDIKIPYTVNSPSIIIITEGEAVLSGTDINPALSLKCGESVFIPAEVSIEISGTFTAYTASTGAQ